MAADKNTYEIYDYLSVPANAVETESDQFVIVHEDGTLFVNKQVQFVSQDTPGATQRCPVYDVTTQQVYVDVNNSTELISVPGNLVVPDGSNNLYMNNYIVQEIPAAETSNQESCLPSNSTNEVEEGVLVMDDQFKHDESKELTTGNPPIADPDKQVTNCTEIILNEAQYKMLQEKGWVLLEISDKTYVLDTLGLRDITHNEDTIEKLKNEIAILSNLGNAASDQKQNDTTITKTGNDVKIVDNSENHVSSTEEAVPDIVQSDIKTEPPPLVPISKKKDELVTQHGKTETTQKQDIIQISGTDSPKHRKVIKLKTTLAAKDIPDKIVLGKTVHGKKLVARVLKSSTMEPKTSENGIINHRHVGEPNSLSSNNPQYLENFEFGNLIEDMLKNPEENTDSSHLLNMYSNMKHLLSIPVFMQSIENNCLVVSKVTKQKKGNLEYVTPTLVPGKVVHLENGSEFIHLPHMLSSLTDGSPSMNNFLHVHITETKNGDTTEGVTVSIQNRPVPLKSKLKDKKKAYACGSCAKLYQTEIALRKHQKNCIENSQTTNTDANNCESNESLYYTFKTQEGTTHMCVECKMVFNKISNVKRHIVTHSSQSQQKTSDKKIMVKEKLYKCNMCPSAYIHPSTLSKHIVQSHIYIQNK